MGKRTVLIVDDDKIIREQLEKEMARNFFITFTATDGRSALEVFDRESVDILLLDVRLPDMDGLDVLGQVKAKKPECEVIVMTGFGSHDIAIKALRYGAIDYLEKPIQSEVLTAAIGRASEKLSEREELSYKNSLLLIDDDQLTLKLLTRALEREGYTVYSADNGKDGLKIIESNKIDVLIVDIQMEGMNGIEVLEQAKKMYMDIEGIMVTGHRDQALAVKALRAGALDYIAKPVHMEELYLSIEKAINNINLNRNRLYRNRELTITSEIINKMNEELERKIEERTEKLKATQGQLFQTSKLATLGEMAAGLAHELNQPLAGISLTSKHLTKLSERDRLTKELVTSSLQDIDNSVKRMSLIIQHIRTFARQDTMKFISVDVPETIDYALNLLGEQLRLREIEIVREISGNLPAVHGEPYQIEQVWINLITNARDALDDAEKKWQAEGKEYQKRLAISVILTELGDEKYVVVTFHDNGVGMTAAQQEKMFEPFYTTKEVGKGTGLGLSIIFGIVESHKGRFEVESEEGKGTTMRAFFPVESKPL